MSFAFFNRAAICLALVACGDSMTSQPGPLFQLHGNVQNTTNVQIDHPERLRITAVWKGPDKTIPFAEDIRPAASFPAAFTLDVVRTPPPEAESTSIIEGTHIFVAEIGAYDDTNQNGHFDYDTGDTLLGIAPRVRLFYLNRPDELPTVQKTFPGAQLGFNLFIAVDDNDCTHPYYPGVDCRQQKIVPLDTPIVLQLSSNAKFE
jgi:hypothetical protein